MVGEHPTQTSLPGDDLKPARRVACVAYRKVRQAGELDQPAWLAARAAIQVLRRDLDEDAAGQQASAAIHYASVFHTKWLRHRVDGSPRKRQLSPREARSIENGDSEKSDRVGLFTWMFGNSGDDGRRNDRQRDAGRKLSPAMPMAGAGAELAGERDEGETEKALQRATKNEKS